MTHLKHGLSHSHFTTSLTKHEKLQNQRDLHVELAFEVVYDI
jgi:hypothetical protein